MKTRNYHQTNQLYTFDLLNTSQLTYWEQFKKQEKK